VARPESRYVCDACGATSLRWEGQCRSCGGWNTLVETPAADTRRARPRASLAGLPSAVPLSGTSGAVAARLASGIGELDRVLGGGLVAGSVVLLGGSPGIGKSTLMLALAAGVSASHPEGPTAALYASGEESLDQLRLRAARLGLSGALPGDRIAIVAETGAEAIVAVAEAIKPGLLIVDSVQTATSAELEGPAGSIGQVRASAAVLQAYAKESGVPVVLVGHVTKDGSLAGPKTLEHLVDVVLTLEGERFAGFRLLRATKNRYGSTEEVGVFEMAADGLREVPDPGTAFVESAALDAPGVAVAATLEGTRPLLVEVQALVAPTTLPAPRRTVSGLDSQRLALLLAVLSRRAGIGLGTHDVYASIVGGLTIEEPAIDLPLAVALASSLRDRPIAAGTVLAGEVGLTGELRAVNGLERRLREAARLGFTRAIVPRSAGGVVASGLEVIALGTLREALEAALAPTAGADSHARVAVPVIGGRASRR
jgi:DNA repair protein RadA/Sms